MACRRASCSSDLRNVVGDTTAPTCRATVLRSVCGKTANRPSSVRRISAFVDRTLYPVGFRPLRTRQWRNAFLSRDRCSRFRATQFCEDRSSSESTSIYKPLTTRNGIRFALQSLARFTPFAWTSTIPRARSLRNCATSMVWLLSTLWRFRLLTRTRSKANDSK